ncbi:MAG: transposase-like zinc-binding domain-containing protein [Candidatus Electronema sp. VV]
MSSCPRCGSERMIKNGSSHNGMPEIFLQGMPPSVR